MISSLSFASLSATLISDASGIYDPRIYDDRLLLGLKGTFSEAQWYNMRAQLGAARLNKAQRGELHLAGTLRRGSEEVRIAVIICRDGRAIIIKPDRSDGRARHESWLPTEDRPVRR